jgi:hypothetical protein
MQFYPKQFAAAGLITAMLVSVLTAIFANSLGSDLTESLYALSGLAWLGFGIYAVVLLLKK